jgi:multisubunit Na+/H+ antiporter MnhB subunit
METLLSGLAVAAVTGLAFLAYRHHDANMLASSILNFCAFGMCMAIVAWTTSNELTFERVKPYISPDRLEGATNAAKSLSLQPWWILALLVAVLYLTFLTVLAKLFDKEKSR